jgi:hypothetical protein
MEKLKLTLILLTSTKWRAPAGASKWRTGFNHLNAVLNPIRHLLALVGVHHFVHVSGISVNSAFKGLNPGLSLQKEN